MKPHFAKFDADRNRWIFGLDEEQMKLLAAGYGCSECLEEFGEFKLRCPVCGHSTAAGDNVIVETPAEWR